MGNCCSCVMKLLQQSRYGFKQWAQGEVCCALFQIILIISTVSWKLLAPRRVGLLTQNFLVKFWENTLSAYVSSDLKALYKSVIIIIIMLAHCLESIRVQGLRWRTHRGTRGLAPNFWLCGTVTQSNLSCCKNRKRNLGCHIFGLTLNGIQIAGKCTDFTVDF